MVQNVSELEVLFLSKDPFNLHPENIDDHDSIVLCTCSVEEDLKLFLLYKLVEEL